MANEPERAEWGDGLQVGKIVVICVGVFAIGMSLATIVMFNVLVGPQRLPAQIIRFVLTVALVVFLYRGHNWARYVAAALFGIAAILASTSMAKALDNPSPVVGIHSVLMVVGYGASAVSLVAIPQVGRFLKHQQRRFAEEE